MYIILINPKEFRKYHFWPEAENVFISHFWLHITSRYHPVEKA